MTCVTNRLDYHYGNARNAGFSHENAERWARIACDSEVNPRRLPVPFTPELSYDAYYILYLYAEAALAAEQEFIRQVTERYGLNIPYDPRH